MNTNDRHIPGTCPGCGAPNSAVMNSSQWGHDFACCSDACGEKVSEILFKNESSAEYMRAERIAAEVQEEMCRIRVLGLHIEKPRVEVLDEEHESHEHQFGPVETSAWTETPHRKCVVPGCKSVSLDLEDE